MPWNPIDKVIVCPQYLIYISCWIFALQQHLRMYHLDLLQFLQLLMWVCTIHESRLRKIHWQSRAAISYLPVMGSNVKWVSFYLILSKSATDWFNSSSQSMMKCLKLWMLLKRYWTCNNVRLVCHLCAVREVCEITSWLKSLSTQLGLSW